MALSCLIVDDNEDFLVAATRLLSVQGVAVVGQASNGADALRMAAALNPDVALVDVELGDEDGIALAEQLVSRERSSAVILISLHDRQELAELVSGSGVAGFLRKDSLDARAVADLMGGRRRTDDRAEPPAAG